MNNFYLCTVCEQIIPKEDIIEIQNMRKLTKTWKECPVCGSKVFPVSDDDFDVRDLVKFQLHRALS